MEFLMLGRRENLDIFLAELNKAGSVSLDTETTSLDTLTCTLLLTVLKVNQTTFILQAMDDVIFTRYILELIAGRNRQIIFHNAKFDLKVLKSCLGIQLTNVYDTMLAEVLINQGIGRQLYSLKSLVKKYCGVDLDKSERESFVDYNGIITQEMLVYSALDVKYLEEIRDRQIELLTTQKQLKVLDLENRLVPAIADIELNGITLDQPYWLKLSTDAQIKAATLKVELIEEILSKINLDKYSDTCSLANALRIPIKTKKIGEYLQYLLVMDGISWIKDNFNTGSHTQIKAAFSLIGINVEDTNEKTLTLIKNDFPIISKLLELREQEKKISSFGADYLKHIHPKDGRIHTDYNQLGTYTGRLSSSKPNLQQIPRSQDYRKAFVAKPGYKLIAVDFSQQEYRLVGAISGEQTIIDAYKAGKDMHAATASIVNNIPIEQVTKEQRNRAKSINFAILYGSTEYGLAFNLQIPVKEARQILENFYSGYPTLKEFKTYMESMIVEKKYSVTVLGRRRYWEDKKVFADGEEYIKYNKTIAKEGFNHTIQGSGADATKIALCNIFYNNPFGAENLKILLQVHDEIVCEVKEDLVEEGTKFIVEEMEKAIQPFLGEIPAIAEPAVGDYWIH